MLFFSILGVVIDINSLFSNMLDVIFIATTLFQFIKEDSQAVGRGFNEQKNTHKNK